MYDWEGSDAVSQQIGSILPPLQNLKQLLKIVGCSQVKTQTNTIALSALFALALNMVSHIRQRLKECLRISGPKGRKRAVG
jgi:hypothetical protein